MTWFLWLGLALCSLAVVASDLWAYGSKRWAAYIRALTHRLEAARNDGKARAESPARFNSHELQDLPAPVQRYFKAVMKEGQPIVSALAIEMVGTFNMSTTTERWMPFTFREGKNMLVIDPDECIDSRRCVPDCPMDAICPGENVPRIKSATLGSTLKWPGAGLSSATGRRRRRTPTSGLRCATRPTRSTHEVQDMPVIA